MARPLDDASNGRHAVGDAVKVTVADALAGHPPAHDMHIDRLHVRLPAGASASEVGRAVARALERAVRERGRR